MNLNRRGFLISTGAAITAVTLPFFARAADKLKIGMIGSKELEYKVLLSTSPANASKTFASKLAAWSVIRE